MQFYFYSLDAISPKFNLMRLVAVASFDFWILSSVNWSILIQKFPAKKLTKIAISIKEVMKKCILQVNFTTVTLVSYKKYNAYISGLLES